MLQCYHLCSALNSVLFHFPRLPCFSCILSRLRDAVWCNWGVCFDPRVDLRGVATKPPPREEDFGPADRPISPTNGPNRRQIAEYELGKRVKIRAKCASACAHAPKNLGENASTRRKFSLRQAYMHECSGGDDHMTLTILHQAEHFSLSVHQPT